MLHPRRDAPCDSKTPREDEISIAPISIAMETNVSSFLAIRSSRSRGCAFLQFFLCLWGVSPAVSASVSQFGQHGAIVARGKPPLRPFGACFGRVGRLVLAASRQKGWARTMGRALEQLSARQVLLTRSMCVGGLGAQGTHAKSTKRHATSEGSANHLLAITWNRPFSPAGRF